MLYLDNSATTAVLPEVQKDMVRFLSEQYGNPSSKYYDLATTAKDAVEQARGSLGRLLDCKQDEIIFTSGATESNNMIIKGVANYYKSKGNHIITTKTEHSSVIEVCRYLEKQGFNITYLDVDQFGRINIQQLQDSITDKTILVSVIWGNNELGSLNDMEIIGSICKEKNVFLHTDATQVVGKMAMSLKNTDGITFLSCSAHKMHGPKGVGLAFIRSDEYGILTPITPLFHGGEQEPFRSGTYAVHNIVGFGKAAEIAYERLEKNIEKLNNLENKIIEILKKKFKENIILNSDHELKIPGVFNVRFVGINNQILLKKLAPIIAASTGSACSTTKPSHVLEAIGLNRKEIQESVRFSLSPYTEKDKIKVFETL